MNEPANAIEINARLNYVSGQREGQANDAAVWHGRSIALQTALEAATTAALEAEKQAKAETEQRVARENELYAAKAQIADLEAQLARQKRARTRR